MVSFIGLTAFLEYRDILTYYFTATDTLTLIRTSRINSLGDLVNVFNRPMYDGSGLAEWLKFYRPIATLSYGFDYFLWELNPFGYHLTDLVLHILASVSVFFLIRLLTHGRQAVALMGALIFTIHPILVETVFTNARHDILATLFLLVSFILWLKYVATPSPRAGYRRSSLIFYILALGAKETAVILPFLIFAYFMLFPPFPGGSVRARFFEALKGSLGYFLITFAFVAWRAHVLHQAVGGYQTNSWTASQALGRSIAIIQHYLIGLLYPRAASPFDPAANAVEQIISLSLLGFVLFFIFYSTALFGRIGAGKAKVLSVSLVGIMAISLIGISGYPLFAVYIDRLLEQAYFGRGLTALTNAMEGRTVTPLGCYFYKAGDRWFDFFSASFLLAATCLIAIHAKNAQLKSFFKDSPTGRLMVFLLVWVTLPLGLYLSTLTFSYWYMYLSVIPFSAALSTVLVEASQSFIGIVKFAGRESPDSSARPSPMISWATTLIILFLVCFCFVPHSPLLKSYNEYKYAGNLYFNFLDQLFGKMRELPNDTVFHIYNLPIQIASRNPAIPHARTVLYLDSFSIKAGMDLRYPGNHSRFVVRTTHNPPVPPEDLEFDINTSRPEHAVIVFRFVAKHHSDGILRCG
jgi:hypothetical protein